MEAFLISTGVVALAEMGDKTQLLAFILAARYKKPWTIILAILLATIANHLAAGLFGAWLTTQFSAETLRWGLGVSFLLMAVWVLIPDQLDDVEEAKSHLGVFGATFMTFFLAEMGDKTQIATVALAAQYQQLLAVVMGATLGMMVANIPAVMMGERIAHKIPMRLVHWLAAALFAVLGAVTLLGRGV